MSLITSCPACGTMFRVVPDQLKISEGWVRCGHCAEVFDASAYLTDESVLDQLHAAQAAAAADMSNVPAFLISRSADLPSDAAPAADAGSTQPATMPVELATRPAALSERTPSMQSAAEGAAPGSSFFGADSESLEASPLDSPFVFRRSDLADDGEPSVLPPAPPREVRSRSEQEDHEPTPAELGDVSFVRQARRRAFWRRPLVRMLLVLVGLALAALLALQFAYQDRDRLALAQPELRPALQRMCELLQCRLGAPRQIESLVIESSSFNRVRDDTYRLAFTLRNTARVPVAVPAMELTVTDAQDQPIARRVLLPADLGAPAEAIPPAAEWSRNAGVVVNLPAPAAVAGYRLLAFYP
jgi:predicted Zn finger-like uncharacterized protein